MSMIRHEAVEAKPEKNILIRRAFAISLRYAAAVYIGDVYYDESAGRHVAAAFHIAASALQRAMSDTPPSFLFRLRVLSTPLLRLLFSSLPFFMPSTVHIYSNHDILLT
jgi:hypothetical protein